jgi:hypothetical protein
MIAKQIAEMVLLGLAVFGGVASSALRASNKSPATIQKNCVPNRKECFEAVAMGDGIAGDGTTRLAINTYRSSGDTIVTSVHGHFVSSEAAIAELQRRMKEATKTVEQGSRKEPMAGQRAVVFFPATEIFPERAAILLTHDKDYYEIISPSLRIALEFEKLRF